MVLDRWRAVSAGSSLVVAEGAAGELVDGDQDALGVVLWEMARKFLNSRLILSQ